MPRAARLSSDLLARKGEALPTIGLAHPAIAWDQPLPAQPARAPSRTAVLITGGRPERPAAPRRGPDPSPGPGPAARIHLTLRLDPDRHTRLEILAARHRQTSQAILLRALDAHLEACGRDCACLRKAVPAMAG